MASYDVSSAADALLNRWKDADPAIQRDDEGAKPIRRSETERNADEDDNEREDEDELDFGDDEDEQDEQDQADAPEASDEALVKLTVDGEEIKIPVKDLKRLYGQEASLTRKSQEVAERRKLAEETGARYIVATEQLMHKATERFKPYAQIDWAIAAKTLDNDEYVALRHEAQAAATDLQFLKHELDGVFADTQRAREAAAMEEAKASLEVLKTSIPNFNADTYNAMSAYAVSKGLPQETFAQITDPIALLLIHEAMSYSRAKERAATKRKAAPTSKRTMKSSARNPRGRVGDPAGDAMKRLQKTGSREDAVAALMERWEANGD
jgi:hypothetical protein